MRYFLDYSDDEIEEMEIVDTQMAKDEMIYLALTSQDEISELHKRIARVQNDVIQTRNFIPPQFFDRYMYINEKCKILRGNDKNL